MVDRPGKRARHLAARRCEAASVDLAQTECTPRLLASTNAPSNKARRGVRQQRDGISFAQAILAESLFEEKRHEPGNRTAGRAAAEGTALVLVMKFEQVSGADERGGTHLHQAREANQQLVLAALSAQEHWTTAEQANKRLTRQLAMVAHELRNPLMPIRTAAALMGRVRADELPRLQAIIERQVERVLGLVADLLDISRISSGKLRLQRQVVDMTCIVAEAVDTCRPAMSVRNQRFDVDVPAHRIEVYGDPARLVQIVSNLLDNASKYTPPGGNIGLAVVATGDEVRVIVRDDGIGMAADVLPHVFGAFTQEEHAVAFNGIGLGIGLSVVHELVKAHGGSVSARSAGVDLGSEFVVTLPLAGWQTLSAQPA